MDETTLLAKASHATLGGQSLYKVTLVKFFVCLFEPRIAYFMTNDIPLLLKRKLLCGFSILSVN